MLTRSQLVQAEAQAEPESESVLTKLSRPVINFASQLEVLVPSGGLVLRAGALAGIVLSAVGLALVSFLWLWATVRVPDSQVENVWLQYG